MLYTFKNRTTLRLHTSIYQSPIQQTHHAQGRAASTVSLSMKSHTTLTIRKYIICNAHPFTGCVRVNIFLMDSPCPQSFECVKCVCVCKTNTQQMHLWDIYTECANISREFLDHYYCCGGLLR